jgi:hypothetical protein
MMTAAAKTQKWNGDTAQKMSFFFFLKKSPKIV